MWRMRSTLWSSPPAVAEVSSSVASKLERIFNGWRLFACLIVTGVSIILGGVAWAALAPIAPDSREEVFEIPKGTYARRMAGEKIDILPQTVSLTLGANDILLLRNLDDVPQLFGPALIMPGQSFKLPFEVASSYSFDCTAHASGQMIVVVHPKPDAGWETLRWRFAQLKKRWGRS